jgi:AcrR family transcriptional regulator
MTIKGERTRQRIIDIAVELFARRGYDATTLRDIAKAADVSTGLAYRYFKQKEDLVLALYEALSEEVERRVRLPEGTVGRRWAALERTRFDVLAPHRRSLIALLQAALDPDGQLGVLSATTAHVRAHWLRLHREVVEHASPIPLQTALLSRLLYAIDLLVVLIWTQDRSQGARATRSVIDRVAQLIDLAIPLTAHPAVAAVAAELGAIFQALTNEKEKSS